MAPHLLRFESELLRSLKLYNDSEDVSQKAKIIIIGDARLMDPILHPLVSIYSSLRLSNNQICFNNLTDCTDF